MLSVTVVGLLEEARHLARRSKILRVPDPAVCEVFIDLGGELLQPRARLAHDPGDAFDAVTTETAEALDQLAAKERKTNGFQLWLWGINAIVLPGLGFCHWSVITIASNRYTSQDSIRHTQVHIEHQKDLSYDLKSA